MNWYGFIIAAGIVLCVIGAYFTAKRRGIEGDVVIDIIIICLPLAIIFARIYYVIFDVIDGGVWTFKRFIGIEDNGLKGLAIYGGLIGATLGAIILFFWKNRKSVPENKRISFMQILDLGFTFIILGQAIGRWGNYANQEAYGYVITDTSKMWFPLAVYIKDDKLGGNYHYATFFYESMWNLIGFGLLLYSYLGKHKSFDGFNFALYCIYYGIGRAWIEGLRADSLWLVPPTTPSRNGTPDIGGIRVSQLLSILLIAFGVAYIVIHIVRARRAGKKVFIFVDRAKLDDDYFGYEKTKLANPMPDIYPPKKKKGGEEIIIDSNGVAIRVDSEDKQVKDNAKESETKDADTEEVKTDKAPPEKIKTAAQNREDDYEDRWDD